jgi:enoyl-CoA hydratase
MATTDSILAEQDGRIGRIRLNRPKALNALNLEMIEGLHTALDAWREAPEVHAVVVEANGGRAFCAGGDIRAIRQHALDGEHEAVARFFSREYALNLAIATYPKPYVALVDGICMGGGIGISVHGTTRVATERAVFAMPETAIGFFPDIGASFFLPRLPGRIGLYLGLTGARMEGPAAIQAGLATHFVAAEALPALSAALARDGLAALAGFSAPVVGSLPERAAIDRCFAADSVAGIMALLAAEGTEWATQCIATLRGMSPSGLLWTFALIRAGAARTLPQCLAAELALSRHVTAHPDFAEGVRAMVVDKDRSPRWQPPALADVAPGMLAALGL